MKKIESYPGKITVQFRKGLKKWRISIIKKKKFGESAYFFHGFMEITYFSYTFPSNIPVFR